MGSSSPSDSRSGWGNRVFKTGANGRRTTAFNCNEPYVRTAQSVCSGSLDKAAAGNRFSPLDSLGGVSIGIAHKGHGMGAS